MSSARFVDDARAQALAKLGISTVGDLIAHYPFRYVDLTTVAPLGSLSAGREVTAVGRVHSVKVKKPRPRLSIVEVAIVDGTGVLLGVWFNQPYMAERFIEGERVALAGPVTLDYGMRQIRNPFVEKLGVDDSEGPRARIHPVHRTTEGLSTNWLRRLVAAAVDDYGDVPDFLPVTVRLRHGLVSRSTAILDMHFPAGPGRSDVARKRLAYEEVLCLQIGLALRRRRAGVDRPGRRHVTDGPALARLRATIEHVPTDDQARAIDDVLADMSAAHPMNRLLLGDVGTGKTLVAAHALCAVADTGSQAAMMAPTEVLAVQYAEKVGPVLEKAGVSWDILTGSTTDAERKQVMARVTSGATSVLFGTHALIEKGVGFADLTLAIVDEQHRFGVEQRLALRSKGAAADLLVMTATPIPRSLALTLYGDLDTSYLRERPTSAGARTTEIVRRDSRERAYDVVREAVAEGRQAYVVCALVDESDAASARAAVKEADRLATRVFPSLRVGLLTGRMRPSEKADVMRSFREGALDVLVSTTVIEVGIDVPNATVMIVEDAERFGLAQLHQLRGRVGRGEHAGRVLLFADPHTAEGKARMAAIVGTDDGFELAEEDLRLRGEGQILGARQSGLPELRLASLAQDLELIEAARDDARRIVESDPELASSVNVPLREEVRARFAGSWAWVSAG